MVLVYNWFFSPHSYSVGKLTKATKSHRLPFWNVLTTGHNIKP